MASMSPPLMMAMAVMVMLETVEMVLEMVEMEERLLVVRIEGFLRMILRTVLLSHSLWFEGCMRKILQTVPPFPSLSGSQRRRRKRWWWRWRRGCLRWKMR